MPPEKSVLLARSHASIVDEMRPLLVEASPNQAMLSGHSEPAIGPRTATSARRPSVLRLTLQPRIARAAPRVSLVAGTVLNIINNGEQFWMHHTVNLWQAALNFFVPFRVSAYSAACNEAQRTREG